MKIQLRLASLFLTFTVVTLLAVAGSRFYNTIIIENKILETIENIESGGGGKVFQRMAILSTLRDSNSVTIRLPVVAFAKIWRNSGGEQDLVVDWVCDEPNFDSIECHFSNGDSISFSSEEIWTHSNDLYYIQSTIPISRVVSGQHSDLDVEAVVIVKAGGFQSPIKEVFREQEKVPEAKNGND